MKTFFCKAYPILVVIALSLPMAACDNGPDEETQKQVRAHIDLIERELKAVEDHQGKVKQMIAETQAQLDALRKELDKDSPRIHAANMALDSLADLTNPDSRPSPLEETLEDPGWSTWNVLWIALFLFIIWLLYRIRNSQTEES